MALRRELRRSARSLVVPKRDATRLVAAGLGAATPRAFVVVDPEFGFVRASLE